MRNVSITKWDNGEPDGMVSGKDFTAPDDFRAEDVTEDYDELRITENGRLIYWEINGMVVYEG